MKNVHRMYDMKNIQDIKENIYITSDEEIKEGVNQWYLDKALNKPYNSGGAQYSSKQDVIVLTTDQDLIKDGVQAIDDEFLEWFVKNPSCEEVKVKEKQHFEADKSKRKNPLNGVYYSYKIIIPKEELTKDEIDKFFVDMICNPEEPKQETLEEFINSQPYYGSCTHEYKEGIELGAKWQQERSQSIVPFDAYNIEVFKIEANEQGKLFAYIEYKITNGNFHFNVVPFTEPKQERSYSEEEVGELVYNIIGEYGKHYGIMIDGAKLSDLFEQFKKK